MSFIFESFVEFVIKTVTSFFDLLIMGCSSVFAIDTGLIENVFPGMQGTYSIILYTAILAVLFLFVKDIIIAMNPVSILSGRAMQSYAQAIMRIAVALFAVFFARQIFGLALAGANTMFQELNKVQVTTAKKETTQNNNPASQVLFGNQATQQTLDSNAVKADENNQAETASALGTNTYQSICKAIEGDKTIFPEETAAESAANTAVKVATAGILNLDSYKIPIKILAFVFTIFVMYNFTMLSLNSAKHYTVLGILGVFVPLFGGAPLISPSSEQIAKNYWKMVGGECLVLFMNLFFVKVGSNALTYMRIPKLDGVKKITGTVITETGLTKGTSVAIGSTFTGIGSAILWCLMIGYFFQVGLQASSLVSSLGFGVSNMNAKTFVAKVAGAIQTGSRFGKGVKSAVKAPVTAAGGLMAGLKSLSPKSKDGGINNAKSSPLGSSDSAKSTDGNVTADQEKKNAATSLKNNKNGLFGTNNVAKRTGTGTGTGTANQKTTPKKVTGTSALGSSSTVTSAMRNQGIGASSYAGVNGGFGFAGADSRVGRSMSNALTQKLDGDEARTAVSPAFQEYGAKDNSSSIMNPTSQDGETSSLTFDTDHGTIPFSGISTDGNGKISGDFGSEHVEMLSEEAINNTMDAPARESFLNRSEKIALGGQNMYVDKKQSPAFASHMKGLYSDLYQNTDTTLE